MKPHKDDQSTPAGVPHLQEVGYTVTYEDVAHMGLPSMKGETVMKTHNRICGPVIFSKEGR